MAKSSKRMCKIQIKLRREIVDAVLFRDGGLYLGGIELCCIIKLFGGVWGDNSATDLVKYAETPELREVHRYLDSLGFIEYGKEKRKQKTKGVVFCSCCGRALP